METPGAFSCNRIINQSNTTPLGNWRDRDHRFSLRVKKMLIVISVRINAERERDKERDEKESTYMNMGVD